MYVPEPFPTFVQGLVGSAQLEHFRMCSDIFGCVRVHLDTFRSVWTSSDRRFIMYGYVVMTTQVCIVGHSGVHATGDSETSTFEEWCNIALSIRSRRHKTTTRIFPARPTGSETSSTSWWCYSLLRGMLKSCWKAV